MLSLFEFNSLKSFNYPPLSPLNRAFRLVQLLPPKPSIIPGTNGTIRIKLIEADVDSGIRYDALSYAWSLGPRYQEPNTQIIVETEQGSHKLYIYPALEIALRYLVSSHMTDFLFIDQISINQRDRDEKSHQVLLMRDIYTKCARTIVWLGAPTRYSDQYFDLVYEMCQEGILSRVIGPRVGQFIRVFDAVMDPSLQVNEEEREDRDDLLDLIQRYGDRFPLDGFADVLDRNWFSRLWVIQEACLAPTVVFLCGEKSLCFDCFRSGALFYNIYNTHWVRQLTGAVPQHVLRQRDALLGKTDGFIRIFQERKAIHQSGIRLGLHDLVLKYNVNDNKRKIGVTLEQDRIFGLLGLAADNDVLMAQVHVDYKSNITHMYSEIAELLLQESIDVLLFNQHPKKTEDLPSWVPDWAMDLAIPVAYASLKEATFAAGVSATTEALVTVKETPAQLHIKGIAVDEIVDVGTQLYHAQHRPQVAEQVDYRSTKTFFDEITKFAKAVATTTQAQVSTDSESTPDPGLLMRMCDSSLSYRHFTQTLGPTTGLERLQALHSSLYTLGERLIRSDEFVASYHITRIYQTIGIVPWYLELMPEMDSLQICALNPLIAGKVAYEAVKDIITDMAGLIIASARVWYASKYIIFRRRFGKVNLRPSHESVEKVGLDPNVSLGPDMNILTTNMLKNMKRKLYRTRTGYMGLGPAEMEAGNSLVIFHGGTTPHILKKLDTQRGADEYQYLGEAYCDGLMDGEIFEDNTKSERIFILV
ncbi:heterokaryon incompatibility domain-containing protein [Trichoderma austrokoningii]